MLIHLKFQSHELLHAGQMLQRDPFRAFLDQRSVLRFLFLRHLPVCIREINRPRHPGHELQQIPGIQLCLFNSAFRKDF